MGNAERVPTGLGEIILRRMVDLGMRRQADLARAANLDGAVINRAIYREARPTIDTLRALAPALGLDINALVGYVYGDGVSLDVTPAPTATDPDVAETGRLLSPASHLTDDEREELRAFLRRLNASYKPRTRRRRPA